MGGIREYLGNCEWMGQLRSLNHSYFKICRNEKPGATVHRQARLKLKMLQDNVVAADFMEIPIALVDPCRKEMV